MKHKVSAEEMLKIFDNQWASTKDIMKIGAVGVNKSQKIKNEICEISNKNGYKLPCGLVPMEEVINYFGININYLKRVAKNE